MNVSQQASTYDNRAKSVGIAVAAGMAIGEEQPEVLRLLDGLDRRLSHLREISQQLERRLEHVVAAAAPIASNAQSAPAEVIQSPLGNRIAAIERDLADQCYALQAVINRLKV
jgi:uncharacterized heparinase superfamily protein